MSGLVLGVDGKERAIKGAVGVAVPSPATIATLYVGLLATLPANHDGLDFATLVTGNEHVAAGDWYTGGRKAFTLAADFDPLVVDEDGARYVSAIEFDWPNTSGLSKTIAGAFVTNVQSGTASGLSLWCGPPDVGGQVALDGGAATITAGGLILRLD